MKPISDDALPSQLQQAVDAMKTPPMPRDAIGPLINQMEHWRTPVARRRRWVWAAASVAASLLVVALWLTWPSDSWAQVVQAMQQKQWIRMTSTTAGVSSINWISPPRGVIAWRRGDAVYQDSRLKVIYRYDESDETIYRLPEDAESRKTLLATQRLFTDILQNKNALDGTIQERLEVFHQMRYEVDSDGKKLIVYQLHCQAKDQQDHRLIMVFVVDPISHLAQRLILKNLTPRSNDEPGELQFQIDYPDQGPLDIYDLGVARTSKYIDRIPPDDLDRMAKAIKMNREEFDNYRGIIVENERSPFALIWRKGSKWRLEMIRNRIKPTGKENVVEIPHLNPPQDLTDPTAWWLEQTRKLDWRAEGVGDGQNVYRPDGKNYLPHEQSIVNYVSTSASSSADGGLRGKLFPELISFPELPVGFQQYEVELATDSAKGPAGTIQLHARLNSPQQHVAHLQRFWVDPTRSYLVMRHEIGEFNTKPEHLMWRELYKLNRTPSGIWYPEVIKGTYFTNMHFYLDFKADLPDELFTPTERTKK